jgi:hypothetical protein
MRVAFGLEDRPGQVGKLLRKEGEVAGSGHGGAGIFTYVKIAKAGRVEGFVGDFLAGWWKNKKPHVKRE